MGQAKLAEEAASSVAAKEKQASTSSVRLKERQESCRCGICCSHPADYRDSQEECDSIVETEEARGDHTSCQEECKGGKIGHVQVRAGKEEIQRCRPVQGEGNEGVHVPHQRTVYQGQLPENDRVQGAKKQRRR